MASYAEAGQTGEAVKAAEALAARNPADKKAADIRKFGADTAFRRVAQPEELSPAYVFLASPVTASELFAPA